MPVEFLEQILFTIIPNIKSFTYMIVLTPKNRTMKKVMLTIVALFMINLTYAQFNFGPKFGISSSELDFSKANGIDDSIIPGGSTMGFHAGVFARVNLGGLYIQPEVLFTQSGGEVMFEGFTADDIREVEFNKLDIPVMVGMKFARFLRIQAGPTLSILLDAEADGLDESIKSGYNDATLGYQAGVGVDIWNLIVDFKYEGNLSTFGDEIFGYQTDQQNNQWIVSVGFKLF